MKPNRNNYRNKLKWWYDLRRYLARKAKEAEND